ITQGGNYEAIYRTTDSPTGGYCGIVINEVSADNTIYQSPRLKRSDWIELYNTTDAPIDIAGFYISDDPADPYKYQLPILSPPLEGPGEVLIPVHGHLVLWADDVQLPFRLANADYNAVMISSPDGQWSDVLYYHAMNGRQSVGRWPDGGRDVYRFDRTTIESANLYTSHAELLTFDPVIVGVATPLAPPPSSLLPSNSSLPLYDLQGRRTHHASPIVISRGKKIITE
ncbi:MAG: lamin tail domain-containing protein, partial [Bacteroidales bacterium]|nr:lamin tail domain-containing protein [Bacteroidales bacterium]